MKKRIKKEIMEKNRYNNMSAEDNKNRKNMEKSIMMQKKKLYRLLYIV